jgi:hypothetical protein
MLHDFIAEHWIVATVCLVLLAFAVGWFEEHLLGRTDLACTTWLFGITVASIASVNLPGLGVFRMPLALAVFSGGAVLVFYHFRRRPRK